MRVQFTTIATDIYESLKNKKQEDAVKFGQGCLFVIARPGTGKTRVGTHRCAHLIRNMGVLPSRIIYFVFTNRDRLVAEKRLKELDIEGVNVTTFHSFAASLLRRYGVEFSIIDETDRQDVLDELGIDDGDDIGDSKRNLTSPKHKSNYDAYQSLLEERGLLDFDELILKATEFTRRIDIADFIIVDEAHDMNRSEFEMVRPITPDITFLLDPNQAIYRWRGAIVNIIEYLGEAYPSRTEINLERSYRHTQSILSLVNSIYPFNNYYTERDYGVKPIVADVRDEFVEARFIVQAIEDVLKSTPFISYGDIAVLYRVNAQASIIEKYLLEHGIPYRNYKEGCFYRRRSVKEIIDKLSYIINPTERNMLRALRLSKETMHEVRMSQRERVLSLTEAVRAIASKQFKHLHDDKTFSDVASHYEGEDVDILKKLHLMSNNDKVFIDEVMLMGDEPSMAPHFVQLLSYHKAKGDEFKVVFCTGLEEGLLPHYRSENGEKNVFYVGCSRAMNRLFITAAKSRCLYDKVSFNPPSRYLIQLPRSLYGDY